MSSWPMRHVRRTLEHWHPELGPLDELLAAWAEQGMVSEYPWEPTPVVVNGVRVWPVRVGRRGVAC
jgi:hypothetical protein